jgi:Carboxypeptidase regulatory-like domain
MGLSLIQSREYNRCQKLDNFFDKNSSIISTYVPFAEEVTDFLANLELFKSYVPEKGINGGAVTTNQNILRKKLSINIGNICATACAYAKKYNNPKLAADVCYNKSTVLQTKDSDMLGIAARVSAALTPLLQDTNFIKYGITQPMLTGMLADATVFDSNIGKAGLIDSGSSIANKKINAVIKLLKGNIKQFNQLVNMFAAAHPDFIAGYKINSAADNTGIHHNGIDGTITSAATGKPIKGVVIATKDGKKITKSTITGMYELIKMRAGDYEVSFSAAGFETKTIALHILRGKITTLDVAL